MAADRTEALKTAKELIIAAMAQKLLCFPSPITVSRENAGALGNMLDELTTRIMVIQEKPFIMPKS